MLPLTEQRWILGTPSKIHPPPPSGFLSSSHKEALRIFNLDDLGSTEGAAGGLALAASPALLSQQKRYMYIRYIAHTQGDASGRRAVLLDAQALQIQGQKQGEGGVTTKQSLLFGDSSAAFRGRSCAFRVGRVTCY